VTVAEAIGRNIVAARRRLGVSQEEASFRASMHRTAIGAIERGEKGGIRVDSLLRIAGALECDPCELLRDCPRWISGQVQFGHFDAPS
jgi:transcriptional regulator with XRE-family HTH domain